MNLTRQGSVPTRGRSILALSVLALLAFGCVPTLAFAASAGYQYEDAPPTSTGKPPSESNLEDGSSSTSGVGTPNGGSGGDGSSAKSSGEGGGSSKAAGAGKDGTGQQGSQAKGDESALGAGKQISAEPGSDGGGSSPLVPILIAIVLLAGASVAYVVIKRRRGDDAGSADSSGSPVSPEAS